MKLRRAHQFHATVAVGDAIGNGMLELQRLFWSRGVASEIYAWEGRPPVRWIVRQWVELRDEPRDGGPLLVHVSMGNPALSEVARLPLPKTVVYHNITPARYFSGISASLAEHSELGRAQLRELASACELGIADSEFNRLELEEAGFERTAVVPILTDPDALDVAPDPAVSRLLADERTSIIVVGQILPQKAVHDAVVAFARYRERDRGARLFIIGTYAMSGPYLDVVRAAVERHGLGDAVTLTGSVPVEQLAAYYRGATALLTMSEHEGFCVPLVEAMRSGLPVVATSAGAIPETLGDAGVVLDDRDPDAVAAALERVVSDRRFREELRARGRRRVEAFSRERVVDRLSAALGDAGWDLPPRTRHGVTVISSDQRCGVHHYSIAVSRGLAAAGHGVTFVGVRHLDTADLFRKVRHVGRGDVVLIEHEAGIFRDVPFVRALIDLKRRGHRIVLSLHELEPEKFHYYRRLSAGLHYRPRYPWPLEAVRLFWVAARVAAWFVAYRTVLALMGALADRLISHSERSSYWMDMLTADRRKRDNFPLALMPLEGADVPQTAEGKATLRRTLGLPGDRFIFISPGFFFRRKRFIEVMQALPEGAVLVLSGTRSANEPEYFDEVMAAARGRADVVVNTDYDSMGRYLAAADCAVLYYEDVFQSAVAAQAVWAGLPCIFSAAQGFRVHSGAGLVASDTAELAGAMREVQRPETYERLRREAGVLRRLLGSERLAPRYLTGLP